MHLIIIFCTPSRQLTAAASQRRGVEVAVARRVKWRRRETVVRRPMAMRGRWRWRRRGKRSSWPRKEQPVVTAL